MSQTDSRIAQLESEVFSLKKQLEQMQERVFTAPALNNLLTKSREAVLLIVHDERLSVEEITGSISSFGYQPDDFTSGKLGWRDVVHPDDDASLIRHIKNQIEKGFTSFEYEHRILTGSGLTLWITCVSTIEYDADGEISHFLVKIKDISKRKQYEDKLQDANENLFVTLKSIGEVVILTDPDGVIDRLNGAAEKMAGIINLKAKNKKLGDVLQFSYTPDFASPVHPLNMKAETCRMVQIDEIFMRCGEKNRVYRVSCNASPIFVGKNKTVPTGYVLVVKDLTAIYAALQAAKESEARMQESESTIRGIFDHSADGMLLADRNGIVREWSSGYERASGISKEMAIGKPLWDIVLMGLPAGQQTGDECTRLENELKQVVGNMQQKMITRHVVHLETGEHRILNVLYFPVDMPGKRMLGAISRDVTDEMHSQELIRLNEQILIAERDRLQTLGDNMPNGCLLRFTLDTQTQEMQLVYVSKTWETTLGVSIEQSLADVRVAFGTVHPDDLPVFMQKIYESAATLNNFNIETRIIRNNEIRWMNAATHPHLEGKLIVWDGFILDITARKEAELALIDEKNRLQSLGDNMPEGCLFRFMMKLQSRQVLGFSYISRTWQTMTGISVEETLADFDSILARIHPDDLPVYARSIEESAANMSRFSYEFRFRRDDGCTVWLKATSSPRLENSMIVWDGFIIDITERKHAEQALLAEKDRLQALGDHFPNGCLFRFKFDELNRTFAFSFLGKTWERLTNIPVEDALSDIDIPLSKVHPDDRGLLVYRIWESYDRRQENFDAELRFFFTPEEMRWVQISTHRHYENGRMVSDGFILDITDRKKAEQELRTEKERLQALGDNFPNGTLFRFKMDMLSGQMSFDYVSGNWEKFMNISIEESLKDIRAIFAKVHPDDLQGMMDRILESAGRLTNFNTEIRYLDGDGSMKWFHLSSHPHREGDIVYSDGFILDITERKLVEQQLARKTGELVAERDRLESLGNNIPDGCLYRFVLDTQTGLMHMVYLSSTWEEVTGVTSEKSMEDITSVFGAVHPDDLPRLVASIQESATTMNDHYCEIRIRYRDEPGYNRWLQMASHPHYEGHIISWDGIMLDVTRRKVAEEQVLDEKERLQALGDNFPNGTLFRFRMDVQSGEMSFDYLSGTWEMMSGVTIEDSLADMRAILANVYPDDLPFLMDRIRDSVDALENIDTEIRYVHPNTGMLRWYQIASHPHREEDMVYSDGFILDVTARKTAETALFAEKERMQALGDNFPDGTLFRFRMNMITGEMAFDYVSGTWERTLGVPAETSLADIQSVFAHVMPDDLDYLKERILNSAVALENIDTEIRYIHPASGLVKWYQIASHPHREGDMVYSDGFILDVTARKTAVQELRSEKERLEALGNNLPEGSLYRLIHNKDTGKMYMEYVSAKWEKVTGLTAASVAGDMEAYFNAVHPDDLPDLMDATNESERNLTDFNVELRLNSNGAHRWVQIVSHPHTTGKQVIWDGIMTDITSRKEAERELKTEKDRLQALGDNIPNGCLYRFVLDTRTSQMHVSYVSATWETVTGVPNEIALADISSIFGAVHPADLPKLQQSIQESALTMNNFNCEIRVMNHGRHRWVQMASHPHFEDVFIIWDGIILDVTRRKEAEQELRSEKERLQALGDNFPGGTLFRFQVDADKFAGSDMQTWVQHLELSYASGTWEKISNVPLDAAMGDVSLPFSKIDPDDLAVIIPEMYQSLSNLTEFNVEIRYNYAKNDMRWFQIAAVPRREDHLLFTDGFILDITERKKTEGELAVYREELERLVKERTEELEATNEELYATNEELYATNEEFAVTNEELHTKNDQLRTEISARKEVMKKLEDSESKVRNFIRQSFEGIMMLDNKGRVIEWNEALEQITGLAHGQALGRHEWDLLKNYLSKEDRKPANFEKMRRSRLEYLEGGREQDPVVEEQVLLMPDGSKRFLQVSTFPIGLAETCYFGKILRDITEQKIADMELEQYRTQLEMMVELKTRELVVSQERLVSLSNNLPGGVIYQMMDKGMEQTWFTYISAYFTDMFELSIDEVLASPMPFYMSIFPEDQQNLVGQYHPTGGQGEIDSEFRILTRSGKTKWIHMRSSHHSTDDGTRVWDGFMIDVTARKLAEQELENTRRQQAILINVLQIVQSAESLPGALGTALSEMGKYTGVSRAYIFEKSVDETTISNTYEWCNEGIDPAIGGLQNIPVEMMKAWTDIFDAGQFIRTNDINTLTPDIRQALAEQGIRSILCFPLMGNGKNYGFVGFDDCVSYREWSQSELELLTSLSQIISTTTRRHRAETSIQLSQQTMRTVLDNVDANIFVTDFDTSKILFANKKIKQVMGDHIEGEECWKVLQKGRTEICDFCPRPHLRDRQNKPTGLYHWEHHNPTTGRWFENTDAAIEWVDGRLVQMEYSTDITDRKLAEEAVRQSEEMYRQLTVASPDAIVVCSPDGQLRFISPKAFELFGVDENTDIESLYISKFIHSHDRRQAYNAFGKMLVDNVAFLPQLLLVRQDKSEFIGEISSATVKDANGKTTSMIMIIRDITRRKMDEMELIRAKEKAEESDKLKSAFLANMSHEIRTPINGIIGFLHFLGSDTLSPKRRQEYINIINNSSIQLVKLIDDIIDVAKIEAKQMNIRPIPLKINELMTELQVFFETYLQANNKERIVLILDDSQFVDACVTFVDPMRLRQVLNNLIGNAVKFTEKGFIRIGYRQTAADQLEFVVEDSGIGLAPDQLDVIFERFRQAELSNSRQYGGTGLGLTISRSLVHLMGGEMRVESTENAGSTFYFTISYLPVTPIDEPIFDNLSDDRSVEGKPFANKSVLLVEPELMKYKYYEKLIAATGAKVTQAETLQQWLDYISQTNHIDTVIADVSVLLNEDIDNIRRIKYVRAGLPVVLILPGPKEGYQQMIRDCQCNMVIELPVDSAEIERVLKRYAR